MVALAHPPEAAGMVRIGLLPEDGPAHPAMNTTEVDAGAEARMVASLAEECIALGLIEAEEIARANHALVQARIAGAIRKLASANRTMARALHFYSRAYQYAAAPGQLSRAQIDGGNQARLALLHSGRLSR